MQQKDIAPELLEKIEHSFQRNIKNNRKIQELKRKLGRGEATYAEADQYAVEIGEALANAFHEHVSSDALPDGKMYYNIASRLISPPLKTSFAEISEYALTMQKGMNEKAQVGIKAQKAKYSISKEKGLIEYVCNAKSYDNVRKSFEADLINFAQAVVTDTLHENAEFQYQAGLSPVIRRIAHAGCCNWCARLEGTYQYEDVRATGSDVYRRHRDCRCLVVYDPGDGKIQNVYTKRWEKQSLGIQTSKGNGSKATPYSERGIEVPEKVKKLINKTPNPGSFVEIIAQEITTKDLRLLTIETGQEYALIKGGKTAIVLRGTDKGIVIPEEIIARMAMEGGELHAHCHPYIGDLIPSKADRQTIRLLKTITGQETSVIISPEGKLAIFNEKGIIEVKEDVSLLTEEQKNRLKRLFGE